MAKSKPPDVGLLRGAEPCPARAFNRTKPEAGRGMERLAVQLTNEHT